MTLHKAVFYTIPELCKACAGSMSYNRMERMLNTMGVRLLVVGGRKFISADELKVRAPDLWIAIKNAPK